MTAVVAPAEVRAMHAELAPAFRELARVRLPAEHEARRAELLGGWASWASQRVGWLEAPSLAMGGRALARSFARLQSDLAGAPLGPAAIPGDVQAAKEDLHARVEALHARLAGRPPPAWEQWRQGWHGFMARAPGWLDARAQERALAAMREHFERHRRALEGTRTTTGALGLTPPSALLDYRRLWDDFVMGTVRVAQELAETGEPLPESNLTEALFRQSMRNYAESIAVEWNAHANAKPEEILMFAGDYLGDFQRVVMRVGNFYQPEIRKMAPDAKLPAPPDVKAQSPIISAIEDAKIVTHGVLRLLAIGAGGALEAIEDLAHWGGRQIDKVTDATPIIAVAVAAVAVLAVMRR
jgi:hypothetical protein